ncbi:MAG: 50S ribosomal protein L24 [Rickettsiales bacterium]|nr:50S ribosomal protein L24 [Rickettsiales bacterium]
MAKELTKFEKKFRVKKGDKVKIITGKDKGKEGEILRVIKDNDRVIVSGANIAKKHTKPSAISAGGIVEKELSIHISNVAVVDPKSGSASKIGYKKLEDGKKVRFAKKSGEVIG